MLDTALEAKVLANKDESKCFWPLIAVIRPVRDRYGFKRALWKIVYFLYICNFLLNPRSGGPRRPRIYHLDKLSRNYNNLLNSENYHLNHFVARSHSFLQSLAEVILLTLLSKDVVY